MCYADDYTMNPAKEMATYNFKSLTTKERPVKSFRFYEEKVIECLLLGTVLSFGTICFSLYFPHFLTPQAAMEIYLPAFYSYDAGDNIFCNSAWTWGTDYALFILMAGLARNVLQISAGAHATRLQQRTAGLLLCYATSVLAGGIAHQFYTTHESRNSASFRFLWTTCVGTVTAASGFMGAAASEVARYWGGKVIPDWFWIGFGGFTTAVCMCGFISFQRPAADIFIAGITQSPPSFYITAIVFLKLHSGRACPKHRRVAMLGFVLNAPLLPMYAILIKYTDMSLPAINTLLHTWLLVTWGMQGLSLRNFSMSVQNIVEKQEK